MTIHFYGLNTVRLQDGGVSILIDPNEETKGALRSGSDVILFSAKNSELKKSSNFTVDSAGEYEVKGVFIYAFNPQAEPGKLAYVVDMEGIKTAWLGRLKGAQFSEAELEHLKNADIILLPVGGGDGYSAKQAMAAVNDFEPRVVVPINYQTPGIKAQLESVEAFRKEAGNKFETVDKLKINKKDLPEEETRFVLIEPAV